MKRASFFLLVFALAMNPLDGFAQKNENPEKIVEKFHSVLLDVMKEAKSLSAKERYIKLEPAIDTAYDLGFMVRVASGTAWRKTSDDHKIKLAKAFRRMSIATYAFRFKGYSGQRFETLKVGNGPRKTKLVFTQIISPPKKNTKREIKVKLSANRATHFRPKPWEIPLKIDANCWPSAGYFRRPDSIPYPKSPHKCYNRSVRWPATPPRGKTRSCAKPCPVTSAFSR